MPGAIGFDIYGTLVDPLEMNEHLRPVVGEKLADRFSELWRNKQIEYTFRRALMRRYEDFGICTRQALVHTATVLDVDLTDEEQERLVEEYQSLRPFPDVIPGIEALKSKGHTLVAFSNGVEATARVLLDRAGVLEHLQAGPGGLPLPYPSSRYADVRDLARLQQPVRRHRGQSRWSCGGLDPTQTRRPV